MKLIKKLLGGAYILGGFVALISLLHAQETAPPVPEGADDVSGLSDLEVELKAVEMTTPAPAADVPEIGTFWSAQHAPGTAQEWPPLPGNWLALPVWEMDTNFFLVDDLNYDYTAAKTPSATESGGLRAMDLTGIVSPMFSVPDYSTNLWLAITNLTGNTAGLLLSNTESDIEYEIQGAANMTDTNWISEGFVLGSEITNWTPASVAATNYPNLFLRVRSWIDTYDMGIPDWWQLEFFGMIGIDPDGNPAGDGYSNLYKYQHGLNPFTSYAPQPPTFSVTPTTSDSGEVISWNPAQGAVTGYTIYRNGSAIATVSASTFSYTDTTAVNLNDPNDADYATYAVQANYSGGSFLAEAEAPFNPKWTISPAIVRGAQGQYILLVPNIPSGVTTIRFYPQPSGATYPDDFFNIQTYLQTEDSFTPSSATNIIDVPVSSFTTNGEYAVPASLVPLFGAYGSFINCRALGADGTVGAASTIFLANNQFLAESEITARVPFVDGTEQLKENLAFQLESADELGSFGFYVDFAEAAVNFPANYAYAGYYFPLDFGSSSLNFAFLDPFKPFEDNYFYRNFVYAFTNLNGDGSLASGAFFDGGVQIPSDTLFSFDEYGYVATGNTNLLAPQLSAITNEWLYSPYQPSSPGQGNIGISETGTNLFLNSGQANVFGLQYQSVIETYSDGTFLRTNIVHSGSGNIPDEPFTEFFYGQVTPPQLETVGYYFAIPNQTYLPGHVGFNPNNFTNSIMITAVGQESLVTAWAQQEIVNGTSGEYGFLQQYFDKAYLADSGGNIDTNNQTGILSEYGEFLATDAGKTFLTTKRDGSSQGQFPIFSIALCTDVNHDGVIDTSFGSPDFTSPARPFRFWINDNNDSGDTGGNDIPGYSSTWSQTPNGKDDHVNGVRDLIDFFPVYIDIQSLLQVMQTNSQYAGLQFRLSQADGALNVIATTNITPNDPLEYLTDTNTALSLANATVTRIPPSGIFLGTNLLANIRDFNEAVLLVEASTNASSPLVLDVLQGTNVVAETQLYLNITGVEQMFRHKNLTAAVTGSTDGLPDRLTDDSVPNEPDTDGNNFILVHGYNINPNEARGVFASAFKELFWSGSHAKFYGVTWHGNESQHHLFGDRYATPNYHTNVVNAFLTAPYLASFLNGLTGTNTLAAHSLGNMVALSALNDGNATNVQMYYMIDAAVPLEAVDGSTSVNTNMVHPAWFQYDTYLWASYWYQLPWPSGDARSALTWNNRLSNFQNATVYNFYSSGEEVLRTSVGSPPSIATAIFDQSVLNAIFNENPVGSFAWAWQEKLKGRTLGNWMLGSNHGGWGFNLDYSTLTVAQANVLPDSQLQTNAFFDTSVDTALFTTNSTGSTYAQANENRILSDAIPAVTLAAGANPVPRLNSAGRNINMQASFENGWPAAKSTGTEAFNWYHSDYQSVAYTYTHGLFDEFVTLGNLK